VLKVVSVSIVENERNDASFSPITSDEEGPSKKQKISSNQLVKMEGQPVDNKIHVKTDQSEDVEMREEIVGPNKSN
jgi:hypothetical protein